MVGKAALIVIIGFSVIFGVAGQYWNRTSTKAAQNFVDYYNISAARQFAEDAANLACDSVFANTKDTSMSLTYFDGPNRCKIVNTTKIVGGRRDCLITVVTTYNDAPSPITNTIQVVLQPMYLNGFVMFSQNENEVNFVTGDTISGPFATNNYLYVDGAPVFTGRATAVKGIQAGSGGNHAKFQGGFFKGSGVKVNVPTDLSATVAGAAMTLQQSNASWTGSKYTYDVYLKFTSDGKVSITTKTQKYSSYTGWTTLETTTAAPQALSSITNASGQTVIVVKNGDVHVSGTVSGAVTVTAVAGSGTTANRSSCTVDNSYFNNGVSGNVIIDDSVRYNDKSSSSSDMLGLVAENSVALATQPSTSGDVNIDAAIFARNGSWTALDYDGSTNKKKMGYININGSVFQNLRGAVGTESGGKIVSGYLKNYRYDPRFTNYAPPFFPMSPSQFQLVSWYEPK